jgi:hypothetical protein
MKQDIVYETLSNRFVCVFWYYYYIESTQFFPQQKAQVGVQLQALTALPTKDVALLTE